MSYLNCEYDFYILYKGFLATWLLLIGYEEMIRELMFKVMMMEH